MSKLDEFIEDLSLIIVLSVRSGKDQIMLKDHTATMLLSEEIDKFIEKWESIIKCQEKE